MKSVYLTKGIKTGAFLQAKAKPRLSTTPACLIKQSAGENEKAKLIAEPLSEDIPFAFEKTTRDRVLLEN